MDFGVGFLSNNVMLPILDFFYQIVPSYGLAIVALTLVIRFALYPLVADSLRKMKRTRVTQPIMQRRMKEIQALYKDNPAKQQEEMSNLYKEFGNPLAGCLPLLFQMPVLFALFATLRGSPFADVKYTVNLQVLPNQPSEQVQSQSFTTKPQNIYFSDGVRAPVIGVIPQGDKLVVGQKAKAEFQTDTGKPVSEMLKEVENSEITPHWEVIKGEDKVRVSPDGTIEALQPGDVTLQGAIPGLASNKGFLFIKALGRVGITDADKNINWDILGMVLFYGLSLYVSQLISGQNSNTGNPQQDTVNKTMPLIVSGMFLFFPLPAGVLMYMVIGNIFQTVQTFLLNKEPLPENLQKMVDEQEKLDKGRESLPFEGSGAKKKEEAPKPSPKAAKVEKKTTKPADNSSAKNDKPSGFTPNNSKKKTSG